MLVTLTLHDPWTVAHRLLCSWDSSGKNSGVGCHSLLQGIFWTQGSNLGILHCKQIRHHLSHQGSPACLYISPNLRPLPYLCCLHHVLFLLYFFFLNQAFLFKRVLSYQSFDMGRSCLKLKSCHCYFLSPAFPKHKN